MWNFFRRVKLISVTDPEKKVKIQQVLSQNEIGYRIKADEIYHRNAFDAAVIGSFGVNKMKMVYSFYVDKKDEEAALKLIRDELR